MNYLHILLSNAFSQWYLSILESQNIHEESYLFVVPVSIMWNLDQIHIISRSPFYEI